MKTSLHLHSESCDHSRMLNPIMGAAILIFLPAKRQVLPFYEINEHFLED